MSDHYDGEELWLMVPRTDFRKAVHSCRHDRNLNSDVLLWLEDGMLHILCGGAKAKLPSRGNWQGQVRVPGKMFRSILIDKGPEDIRLELTEQDLRIEGLCLPCVWQKQPSAITIPVNSSTYDILQKLYGYSPSQIDEAGHGETYRKAQEETDAMIKHAAMALKPLQITEADLRELLEQRLKQATRP